MPRSQPIGKGSQNLARTLETKRSGTHPSFQALNVKQEVIDSDSTDSEPYEIPGPSYNYSTIQVQENTASLDSSLMSEMSNLPNKIPYKDQCRRVKMRHRPGGRALKEIRFFQNQIKTTIPRAPFGRLVREILASINFKDYKLSVGSLMALQVSSENSERKLRLK